MNTRLMSKTPLFLVFALCLVFVAAGCKSSQTSAKAPKWEKLGERVVNFKADHDEIPVTAQEGRFTALKLRVKNAPVFVKNVRIVYGNGDSQNHPVGKRIPAGSETPPINLPGDKRIVKKVVFNYKSAPNRGMDKAVVVLWGRH